MTRSEYRRRDFLKCSGLGLAAFALSSCVSNRQGTYGQQPFTFVQLCDTQLGMGGYDQDVARFEATVEQINAIKPDFVVICGDLIHSPNAKSFEDFLRIRSGFTVPCYCAAGNHDITRQPTLETLANYRRVLGEDYYSIEHKGHLFAFINTQLWKAPVAGETEKHDLWLEKTLSSAKAKGTPVWVVGHYPLFLKDLEEAEEYMNLPPVKRKQILAEFERSGVVAVLGGHTHKLIINEYNGIQLVNGETTSKNFDKRPFGFRLWHVGESRPYRHEFVVLTGF